MLIQRKGTVKEVSETVFKRKFKELGYKEVKKEVKKLEQVYGDYLTLDFVRGLKHISDEAKIRARYNLDTLVKNSSTDDSINVCVDAEKFWQLLSQECKEWLDVQS